MSANPTLPSLDSSFRHNCQRVFEAVQTVITGKPEAVTNAMVVLLAQGHVLVEGVPGLGKTLLVRALARCFDGSRASSSPPT